MSPIRPSAWRSSGMRATPTSTIARGGMVTCAPASDGNAPRAAVHPLITSASRLCPLPETPAIPTTSPPQHDEVHVAQLLDAAPCRWVLQVPARACRALQVAALGGEWRGPPSVPRVRPRGSGDRPLCHHLAATQHRHALAGGQDFTELVRYEDDGQTLGDEALQCFGTMPPTPAASDTAVGSSRMRMRASRYSAFRISTRCRSPTESGDNRHPDQPQGQSLRPAHGCASRRRRRRTAG